MNGLDFRRGTDLFMGSERELALALGIPVEELRRYREQPGSAPREVMARLGKALVERGRGMVRVGEIVLEG